uniref:Uncharacterized protein n=1 Tax=Aegilops tauschii subsp. strangulata TaxID=200361 RepID=A0A453RZY3_AEGTS
FRSAMWRSVSLHGKDDQEGILGFIPKGLVMMHALGESV